jgi:osomolarity two-component system response regulator SKN7
MSTQQMPLQSPIGNAPANYMQHPLAQQPMSQQPPPMGGQPQFSMTQAHPQQVQLPHPQQPYQTGPLTPGLGGPQRPTHRRVMSDMSGGPPQEGHSDKRQRMYAPTAGYQH